MYTIEYEFRTTSATETDHLMSESRILASTKNFLFDCMVDHKKYSVYYSYVYPIKTRILSEMINSELQRILKELGQEKVELDVQLEHDCCGKKDSHKVINQVLMSANLNLKVVYDNNQHKVINQVQGSLKRANDKIKLLKSFVDFANNMYCDSSLRLHLIHSLENSISYNKLVNTSDSLVSLFMLQTF